MERAPHHLDNVRCQVMQRLVASLTTKGWRPPSPEAINKALEMTTKDDDGCPIPAADRNWLLVREIGQRTHTACCPTVGLKALYVAHKFLERGHPSFREAVSKNRNSLHKELPAWKQFLVQAAGSIRQFNDFAEHYADYIVQLSDFLMMSPRSIYEPEILGLPLPCAADMPSELEARAQLVRHMQGIIEAAIALLRTIARFSADDAYFEYALTVEILKSLCHDSRRVYVYINHTLKSRIAAFPQKLAAQVAVEIIERFCQLFEAFDAAGLELSAWYRKLNCHPDVFPEALPSLKPLPKALVDVLRARAAIARAIGIDAVGEGVFEAESESLESVLQRAGESSPPSSNPSMSEDTLNQLLSPRESLRTEGDAVGTPNTSGNRRNTKPRYYDENDSLADLMSHTSSGSTPDLKDEPSEYFDILTSSEDERAVMVSASANSECATRRFHLFRDEVLGKGAYGVVFKAWDRQEGRYVAVKEITVQVSSVKELFSEFRTQTSLAHANVVQTAMFSLSKLTGRIFMEWMPAGSLHQVLQKTQSPFPEPLVRRYIADALSGLAYLHSMNIVHRDIKPSNMLLSVDGRVKLTDFGSSRVLAINGSMKTGTLTGTVPFLSPEAVKGAYSPAVDIWAIGCSIIELLTTRVPWTEWGAADQVAMIFHIGSLQPPAHMPAIPAGVSEDLRSFLEQCFVFEPKERPTAEQLLAHPFIRSGA